MKDINLLPQGIQQQKKLITIYKRVIFWGIILVAVMAFFILFPVFQMVQASVEKGKLEQEIKLYASAQQKAEKLAQYSNDIEKKSFVMDFIGTKELAIRNVMRVIETEMPTGVSCSKLRVSDKLQVDVGGVAINESAIGDFAYNLGRNPECGQVKISSIGPGKDKGSSRDYSIKFNYIMGGSDTVEKNNKPQ